jgi:uncharacterized protein (TIGR03437 family)
MPHLQSTHCFAKTIGDMPVRFAWVVLCFIISSGLFAQSPSISAVANLASGETLLAPGTLAAILGRDLTLQQPSTVPISVLVNGIPGMVLTSAAQELTVQLPVEGRPGPAVVQVIREGGGSLPFPIRLETHAPGIFTSAGNLGAVFHLDGRAVTLSSPAESGGALTLLATGLGPTNPPVGTGVPGPANPRALTVSEPTVMVGRQRAVGPQAFLEPGAIGRYRVSFTMPPGLPAGNQPLSLEIGGKTSNTVLLPVAGPALPVIQSVVNAASFARDMPVSPGSIATVFGLNFGERESRNVFPATSFEGLSVTFNGLAAPLFAVIPGSNQVNLLVPAELSDIGTVNVQISTSAGPSARFPVQLAPAAPGIFRLPDPSNLVKGNAAALLANTAWLVVPTSLAGALRIPSNCAGGGVPRSSVCGQPAAPGDVLQVFVTGLGRATAGGSPGGAVLATGQVAPANGSPLYVTVDPPTVTIGLFPAEVLFSGLAPGFAGLYQLNVRVPPGAPAGDEVALSITSRNGLSETATVAIRR